MVTMPLTLEAQRVRSLEDACLCAKLAEDFRGRDTVVLDLTAVTPIVDFFVIATGTNPRQARALAEEVRRMMKSRGNASRGVEGDGDATWILQDYGDIVLHVFQPAARDLYDLERLWADAKKIDWRSHLGLPAAPVTERL
jgi:ribosome-associated protein